MAVPTCWADLLVNSVNDRDLSFVKAANYDSKKKKKHYSDRHCVHVTEKFVWVENIV